MCRGKKKKIEPICLHYFANNSPLMNNNKKRMLTTIDKMLIVMINTFNKNNNFLKIQTLNIFKLLLKS